TLVVDGAVKPSINNTTLAPGESTRLNFELKQRRSSVTATKGTHRRWVPPFTGSRLPGRWIEVDDSISWARPHLSTNNVVQVRGKERESKVKTRGEGSPPYRSPKGPKQTGEARPESKSRHRTPGDR